MSEKCNGVKAVVYFTWENKILAVKPWDVQLFETFEKFPIPEGEKEFFETEEPEKWVNNAENVYLDFLKEKIWQWYVWFVGAATEHLKPEYLWEFLSSIYFQDDDEGNEFDLSDFFCRVCQRYGDETAELFCNS
jgi:hypothetical protein